MNTASPFSLLVSHQQEKTDLRQQLLQILIIFWFPGTETNVEFLLSGAVCSLCEPPPISMCEGVFAAVCDRLVEVLVLYNIHLLLTVTERTGAAADSHLIIFSLLKHLPFLFLCKHSFGTGHPQQSQTSLFVFSALGLFRTEVHTRPVCPERLKGTTVWDACCCSSAWLLIYPDENVSLF